MTSKLLVTHAVALSAVLMLGTAGAARAFSVYDQTVAPMAAPAHATAKVDWHYAQGYHYIEGNRSVSGWVAVLNTTR